MLSVEETDGLLIQVTGLVPPSLNKWERISKFDKALWKKRMEYQIHRQWIKDPKRLKKARIVYTRLVGHHRRFLDEDNLASSFKPIGDALVRLNIIPDDNPGHLSLDARQRLSDWEGFSLEISEK